MLLFQEASYFSVHTVYYPVKVTNGKCSQPLNMVPYNEDAIPTRHCMMSIEYSPTAIQRGLFSVIQYTQL